MWVQDRGKIVEFSSEGNPLRMVGSYSDISRRKEYEQSLHLSANVFTYANEAIMITERESDYHSKAFFERMQKDLGDFGYWRGEIWNFRKNGTLFPTAHTITAVKMTKMRSSIMFYSSPI